MLVIACKEMNCLPGPGGWLDQDAFVVYGIEIVFGAMKAKEQLDQHQRELQQPRR